MLRSQSLRLSFIFILTMVACLYVTGQAQEMVTSDKNVPRLMRVTPASATPGTELEIEGYRLGWPETAMVVIRFVQGTNEVTARPTGGGWHANDLAGALQQMKVTVPVGVAPGHCQIIIEANGFTSAPMPIEIDFLGLAPEISELSPRWASPGELVWVTGSNFGVSDEVEIKDARGKIHRIAAGSTSSGIKSALTLPEDVAEGEATIQLIENRTGTEQRSNTLNLFVSKGPLPLDLWTSWLTPVAPGQWLDLVVTTTKPLELADRAEVLFQQHGVKHKAKIVGINFPRVRVPETLTAGPLTISTRTTRAGRMSAWSEPVPYRLLERPAAPMVMSLEVPLMDEPVFIGPSAPELLTVMPGESIKLRGRFHVAANENLRIILVGPDRLVTCTPNFIEPGAIKVELPANLDEGDWQITVCNTKEDTQTKLPIRLRIE